MREMSNLLLKPLTELCHPPPGNQNVQSELPTLPVPLQPVLTSNALSRQQGETHLEITLFYFHGLK